MHYAVLVWWKADADQQLVQEFLDEAPGLLAQAPFISCVHGSSLTTANKLSADWGYVAEMTKEAREQWSPHPAHMELIERGKPIIGEIRTMTI